VVDHELEREWRAEQIPQELLEERPVVVVHEVAVELVRRGDLQLRAVEAHRAERREPALEHVGAQAAAQSPPDGYTLFIATSFLATNPYLSSGAGYDPIADFTPVTRLTTFTNVIVVPNSSPARSIKEFADYAKAKGGKITFASPGTGTIQHLAGELFKRVAGIEMTHVPYRGGGPAINDLIPGRIDSMFARFSPASSKKTP